MQQEQFLEVLNLVVSLTFSVTLRDKQTGAQVHFDDCNLVKNVNSSKINLPEDRAIYIQHAQPARYLKNGNIACDVTANLYEKGNTSNFTLIIHLE